MSRTLDGEAPTAAPAVPAWIWGTAVVLTMTAAIYIAAVIVDVLPPSPARQTLLPAASRIIEPWFEQQWTLFAPTPPITISRLYLMVHYRDRAGFSQPRPIDLSRLYQTMAEDRRWAPPRLYRVTMDFAVEIDRAVLYGPARPKQAVAGAVAAARSEASTYFAPSAIGQVQPIDAHQAALIRVAVTAELQRLLSASAHDLCRHPGAIAAVRGIETDQRIPPFTHPHRTEPQVPVFDTGWLPYIRHVAS